MQRSGRKQNAAGGVYPDRRSEPVIRLNPNVQARRRAAATNTRPKEVAL